VGEDEHGHGPCVLEASFLALDVEEKLERSGSSTNLGDGRADSRDDDDIVIARDKPK
jgi:hypothetical protein